MSVCKGDVKGFHKLLKNGIKTESSIILLLNILQLSCTSEVYGKKTESVKDCGNPTAGSEGTRTWLPLRGGT